MATFCDTDPYVVDEVIYNSPESARSASAKAGPVYNDFANITTDSYWSLSDYANHFVHQSIRGCYKNANIRVEVDVDNETNPDPRGYKFYVWKIVYDMHRRGFRNDIEGDYLGNTDIYETIRQGSGSSSLNEDWTESFVNTDVNAKSFVVGKVRSCRSDCIDYKSSSGDGGTCHDDFEVEEYYEYADNFRIIFRHSSGLYNEFYLYSKARGNGRVTPRRAGTGSSGTGYQYVYTFTAIPSQGASFIRWEVVRVLPNGVTEDLGPYFDSNLNITVTIQRGTLVYYLTAYFSDSEFPNPYDPDDPYNPDNPVTPGTPPDQGVSYLEIITCPSSISRGTTSPADVLYSGTPGAYKEYSISASPFDRYQFSKWRDASDNQFSRSATVNTGDTFPEKGKTKTLVFYADFSVDGLILSEPQGFILRDNQNSNILRGH